MKNTITLAFQLILLLGIATVASAQKMRTTKWESGQLERREKVGIWEYYGYTASQEKVVVQRYDHSAKALVYYRPSGDMRYRVEATPGQWASRVVDQPPLFIGGDPALATYTTQLQYPEQAQTRNIQGQVTIAFAIDTLGQASDHRVVRSIGGGCDQEALRVVRTVPNEWIPARLGTRAVPTEYELTLTFRLAKP